MATARNQETTDRVRPRIAIDALTLRDLNSGVEHSILATLQSLATRDCPFDFLVYLPRTTRVAFSESAHFRVIRVALTPLPRLGRIVWEHTRLGADLRRHGVDLLWAPCYIAPATYSVPIITTVHDLIALEYPQLCKISNRIYFRLALPGSLLRSSRILVPTRAVRDAILQKAPIPIENVVALAFGIHDRFRCDYAAAALDTTREQLKLPRDYILFVGRLEPKKNVPALIGAFEAIAQRFPALSLVIAGANGFEYDRVYDSWHASRYRDRIHFLGYVADESLPAVYAGAKAFVFPSICEGFGFPPLEAMACGTPVIASTCDALRENLGDAALLVTPEPAAIAAGIERVLQDPELAAELRVKGRERANSFRWGHYVDRLLEQFALCLHRP